MKLHERIKLLRLMKNYTQKYMADELGLDVTNYSRLERGESAITIERLQKIAAILDTKSNSLLFENDAKKTDQEHLELLKEILVEIKNIRQNIKQ